VTFPTRLAAFTAGVGAQVALSPHVLAEPELAPYTLGASGPGFDRGR
jgi:hypothetical protein